MQRPDAHVSVIVNGGIFVLGIYPCVCMLESARRNNSVL